MTDYFEVLERDGPARLGELRLEPSVSTPATIDDRLRDAGSLWQADRAIPDGDDSFLTLFPHRAFPAGTSPEVRQAFAVDAPDVEYPSATVLSSEAVQFSPGEETDSDESAALAISDNPSVDAYVLSDVQGFSGHAAGLTNAILGVKEAVPADTALYLSGIATPANVATLAYVGVDLFDRKAVRIAGSRGRYLTADGDHFLEDLRELPCSCPACQTSREAFTRDDCIDHNVNTLAAELRRVRERIRAGRLRDYIEAQARHEQWLTATFREFDQQYGYLEERTPVIRNTELTAASEDTLRRVEIQRFAERVTTRYTNRFSNPLVLLPCSARKPYSDSQSHKQFHDAIQWRAHIVSMTSPIGVVPQELELTYPAQHYDSVVTGRWSEDEKEFLTAVLGRYLERNSYPRVIAHVPDEGYRDICERVADRVNVPFEYTTDGHPTSTDSLGTLQAALDGELQYAKRQREHNTVRAVADYMLGPGAGDEVFGADGITTTGRYPKLQVRARDLDRDDTDSDQLATLVPQYGVLAFTLTGARRWLDSDAPTKRVEIDPFVPHGSVLAPGVVDADADIRVGDEVVIDGSKAFAVGRAAMSGPEMVESTRGVASSVRHVQEL